MQLNYRELLIDDYDQIISLWKKTPGVGLSEADSRENIAKFLKRNPGLSFISEINKRIVGTILSGHDGRRGYIYHMMVDEDYRNNGIGRNLVMKSLEQLHICGIKKCHLFVFKNNDLGREFWERTGWINRNELLVYSKTFSRKRHHF